MTNIKQVYVCKIIRALTSPTTYTHTYTKPDLTPPYTNLTHIHTKEVESRGGSKGINT